MKRFWQEYYCQFLSDGHNTLRHYRHAGASFLHERKACHHLKEGERFMLKWAAIFFVIALIAALFGFTGIAAGAATIAKFLFFLFVTIFVVLLLLGLFAGSKLL